MASSDPTSTQLLIAAGVDLEPGLTDHEVDAVERRHGFTFLREHRDFLQRHLPTGDRWPDWRHPSAELQDRLDWPVEGALFDVAQNQFWFPSWGARPRSGAEAVVEARRHLADVPTLVPVYSHRYLPAAPALAPAPVLSVYQTDVIQYGADLEDYLHREFAGGGRATPPRSGRIPFWDDLAEGPDDDHPVRTG